MAATSVELCDTTTLRFEVLQSTVVWRAWLADEAAPVLSLGHDVFDSV